ncbi:MAG: 50S ribosomal protein L30 [Candidatus Aenigmarchaeota archaeon]|nr:50S ribosomal protein L30 [Candidatus Aenigmarchaeota archaeon]
MKVKPEVYAIVRIRGSVKTSGGMKDTLRMLRLTRVNHCVIYPKTKSMDGMLKKAEPWITWGEVRADTLAELVARRGRKPGDKRLDEKEVKEVSSMILNEGSLRNAPVKPVFRLSPPSKGHGSTKMLYPKGAAGYRGEAINELLKRMI